MFKSKNQLDVYVSALHQDKKYRPVTVGMLYNQNRHFLLFQAAVRPTIWSFPQGGIEEDETFEKGFSRELNDEAGIIVGDLTNICYGFHHSEVDYESTRARKRGFSKGKAYIYTLAEYIGDGNLILRPSEVLDAKWVSKDQVIESLGDVRMGKVELTKIVLEKAGEILNI